MSGNVGGVELLSIIKSSLDASGYVAGAQKIQQANAQIATSGEKVAGGQEKITRGMDQAARKFAELVQKQNPAARAAVEFADAQARADRALRLGLITQDAHTKAITQAEAQYRKVTAASNQTANAFGVTARQAQQLAPQINDVVTSLLGGASAFQVLTQQGGQITQAMGGVGNTFRAIAGLFTPMRVGVLAVGAALVGSFAAYEGTERRLASLRNQLRGYTSDYEAMARRLDRSARDQAQILPGVSASDVRTVQTRLAQVVRPEDRQNLERYTEIAVDLARTLDKDLSSAAERVATVIRRPAEAARDLAERGVRGFDENFRRHIELMDRAGDRGGAAAEVFKRLNATVGGAAQDMAPAERAIDRMDKALERLWTNIKDGLATAAEPFVRWLLRVQEANPGETFVRAMLRSVPPDQREQAERDIRSQLGWAGSGAANVPPAAGTTPPANAAAARQGYDFLRAQGWSHAAASGLVARVDRESAFNPNATHDGGIGFGILGWNRSRLDALGQFIQRDPRTATIDEQWRFMHHELTQGSERAAGDLLRQAQTPEQAGRIASRAYARPGRANDGGAFSLQEMVRTGQDAERFGRVLSAPAAAAGAANAAPTPGAVASPTASSPAEPTPDQRFLNDALTEVRRRGTPTGDIAEMTRDLERFRRAQQMAAPDSAEYREFGDAIEQIRARIAGTERPIDAFIRGQREAARIAGESEGAARELAQAMQGLEEAARAQGRAPTEDERAQVRQAVLERAASGYRDLTANVDRQIEAENRLAQAVGQGAEAMQAAEARAKAMEDVRRQGLAGTSLEAAAVEALTQKYIELARAQGSRAIAARLDDQRRQTETLRAELGTIGMSESDRALAQARITATADANRLTPGGAETDAGRQYISNAVEQAGIRNQMRAMKEAEGYGREFAGVLVNGFRAIYFEGRRVGDAVRDMDRALLDLGTRALVLKPLEDALGRLSSSLFGGSGGGGGGLLGGLGQAIGLGGVSMEVAGAGIAKGFEGAAGLVTAAAPLFHEGGEIGVTDARSRVVPLALFRGAPRFHGGGLIGSDERPIIARVGETIRTREQEAALSRRLAAGSSRTINQTVIVKTDDPGAFQRTRGQMARDMRRELARASRSA